MAAPGMGRGRVGNKMLYCICVLEYYTIEREEVKAFFPRLRQPVAREAYQSE